MRSRNISRYLISQRSTNQTKTYAKMSHGNFWPGKYLSVRRAASKYAVNRARQFPNKFIVSLTEINCMSSMRRYLSLVRSSKTNFKHTKTLFPHSTHSTHRCCRRRLYYGICKKNLIIRKFLFSFVWCSFYESMSFFVRQERSRGYVIQLKTIVCN